MSLTNTLASLALGVATEGSSSLLENTFDAATSELAQEGREMAQDAGHSLSQHLAQNPRHALEQNRPHTRIVDTRFLAKAPLLPLTKPLQDLALAGIGATGQDLVKTGLAEDITLPIMREVLDWAATDSDLRFYGEPLALLTLLGGTGLTGLGLGAFALKTLTRKPPKTNRDSAGTGTAHPDASGTPQIEAGTEAPTPSFVELLDDVLAKRGFAPPEGDIPFEERPTESGGTLDVDPPSRADPPTRLNVATDEVPVGGAPADLGAPPLAGEASGVAALPFGPASIPAPREDAVEEDLPTVFVLPASDEDGDIEIDLSGGDGGSLVPDVGAVEDSSSADIAIAGEEEASPGSDGSEVAPAETGVQTGPITVIEAPYSVNKGVTVNKDGEILLPPDSEIAEAFFSDVAEGEVAPLPPPRAVLAPATALEEEIGLFDDRTEDMDRDPKVTRTSGEDTDSGSERQRDQLREEVVADSDARAPAVVPPVELPRTVVPQVVPPTEPAEPVVIRPPVRPAPPPPRIVERRVTPLPDASPSAPAPLPVAVGPSPEEPRPVVPVPPRPIISPAPPPPEPAPVRSTPRPMPDSRPAPSLWERSTAWLSGILNGLVSARVDEAERPADDPLVYKGPVVGSKSREPMTLRVPLKDQQIKDRMTIPNSGGGDSPVVIDLSSRPLQNFLETIFPFAQLNGLDPTSTARNMAGLYSQMLESDSSFSRVAGSEAHMDRDLDRMIIDGHLRNRPFAAVMMQLAFERVGIYSEIMIGTVNDEFIFAIAVYPNRNYKGAPTAYINVSNVTVSGSTDGFADFRPIDLDWLPWMSKKR